MNKVYFRKIVPKGKSLIVTIPRPIVTEMGVEEGQMLKMAVRGNVIIIEPTDSNMTTAESEMDKYNREMDRMMGDKSSSSPTKPSADQGGSRMSGGGSGKGKASRLDMLRIR